MHISKYSAELCSMNNNQNENTPYIGRTEDNYQRIDYTDGDLAIINHLTYTPHMHATQTDMVFVAMCAQGEFTFKMDGELFTISNNQIFIGHPNAIYDHFVMSNDLECKLLAISKPLLLEMLFPNQAVWNKTLYLNKHFIMDINQEETMLLSHMDAIVSYNIHHQNAPFRKEIIRSLVQAVVYEICHAMSQRLDTGSSQETNQKKILFDKFISLISNSEIKKHPLNYYADILCVSARYLTMVCKEVSNRTAYDWVCEYVQNDVRYYLLHTNLTIKEISTKLGFCNLSFFGKYVRENFGYSPSDFRKRLKKE